MKQQHREVRVEWDETCGNSHTLFVDRIRDATMR